MKKDKKKIKEALLEGLVELIFTVLFFGIGAFIVSLFGVDLDAPNIDFDLLCLLGIVVPIVIFCAVCALVKWVKKTIKGTPK